jgi:predicted ATPase
VPASEDSPTRLEVAHVLFMDLVGYSRLTIEDQSRRIATLQDIVRQTDAYREAHAEASVLAHPAGDGVALAFFGDPSFPARCAIEVAQATRGSDDLPLRMGVHSGPIHRAEDINDTPNVRGPGINLAQRVMDCGDAGNILLSYMTAEALIVSEAWKSRLHDLGEVEVKHGVRIRIYSLSVDEDETIARPAKVVELAAKWAAEHRTHNLPAALTSFVGREGQIETVKARLADTRLLTLTGTGGTGKTRLSLRVGEEVLGDYPDGVWFVELASIADAELIVDAVAAVLDVRDSAEQALMTTLTRYLDGQQALLILDNCEHLVEGAATFALEFLTACAGPRILATSREVLGVNGEATWRVPSLSMPEQDEDSETPAAEDLTHFEAVRLFVDRASAVSDFTLTDENASVVAAICRRLDGIPLAIELAAARVRAMSVEQIHDRLDERFRLLTGGGRASPRRQQTLRALVDWSYRLLDEPQQTLFARLSVFAGGFTMEAAEDVCAFGDVEAWDVLDLLLQFVDKSLVVVEESLTGPRYRMLETLREYGLERVYENGDTDEARCLHAAYYGKFVTAQEADFQGLRQLDAFDMVEEEMDNIRQALSWSIGTDPAVALQLAADLGWYWNQRGHWVEALHWQAECQQRCRGARSRAMAWMLARKSFMHSQYADGDTATREAEEAREIASEQNDDRCIAWCEISLAFAQVHGRRQTRGRAEYLATLDHCTTALDIFRRMDDQSGVASALLFQVLAWWLHGDADRAQRLAVEAARIARHAGPRTMSSATAYLLGGIAWQSGRLSEAEDRLEVAVELARAAGNLAHESYAIIYSAYLHEDLGDYVTAYAQWVVSHAIHKRLGLLSGWHAIRSAACARALDRPGAARIHWEEALSLFAEGGDNEGVLHARLALADWHMVCGCVDEAQEQLRHATEAGVSLEDDDGIRACFNILARLRYARGHRESAVRLLGFARERGVVERAARRLNVCRLLEPAADAASSAAREALGAAQFAVLFQEGSMMGRQLAFAQLCGYLGISDPATPGGMGSTASD